MAHSERHLLDALSRTPFVDSTELAGILGEPHATVHRALAGLLADGIVGRASHGTAHLPSSQRYHLTVQGIRAATEVLGFDTPSDFVRGLPHDEGVAHAAHTQDGRGGQRLPSRRLDVPRHRRAQVPRRVPPQGPLRRHHHAPTDGRSFGIVRQGLALRRRSLYDRLRAIAEYDYSRRPGTVLILVPSVWEERLTTRFCDDRNIDDCYVAVESQGRAGETGPSPLVLHLVGDRKQFLLAEGRGLPQQPRRRASHSVAGAEAGVPAPARAHGRGCAGLRRQPV